MCNFDHSYCFTLEDCVQPRFNAIVAWILLAQFCFFATTHQTTLSQIEWKAAFVGRTVGIGQSKTLSALLVLLNTFCGPIFLLSLYSLLSISPFTLFSLFPKLTRTIVGKGHRCLEAAEVPFDASHGELMLYEKEHYFMGSLLKLACQFYMLQGLKVCNLMPSSGLYFYSNRFCCRCLPRC